MNWNEVKRFFRDYTLPLSAVATAAGVIFTVIGVAGVFFEDRSWVQDNSFFEWIGYWDFICLFAGGLLLMTAVFYLYDVIQSRRKFHELTDTPSKSKILHNFEEIDKLAYKLGTDYIYMWRDIKRKHKIKK